MALNLKNRGQIWNLPVTAGLLSGAPVVFGSIPGNLITDADASNNADVDFGIEMEVWTHSCKGENDLGNDAIAVGQLLYKPAASAILNKVTAGREFGIALGTVGAGLTANCDVLVAVGLRA
jgi:hypothetical protein